MVTHETSLAHQDLNSKMGGIVSSRSKRDALMILTIFGFALPVAVYFWFIQHYGVNVIFADQWNDVNVIAHSYSGTLSWGALWAAHNEERLLFPNLLVVLLGHTTHLNLFVEMDLGAVFLVIATGLFVMMHKRRSVSTKWLYYCPVAIMLLSLVQYQNTLWGFQLAWYMIMALFAVALFVLDRPTLTGLALLVGIAAAVVGSFSSLQGLLIWPAGLVLLYQRRRPNVFLLIWIGVALVTGSFYFYRINTRGSQLLGLNRPLLAVKFFFFAIGDVVGQPLPQTPRADNNAVLVLGVVIFIASIGVLFRYGIRRDERSAGPIGVALICFGLLFVLSIALGRAAFRGLGLWNASQSRYTTVDLLILVGMYLAVLTPATRQLRRRSWERIISAAFRIAVLALVLLQVVLGTYNGLAGGRSTHASRSVAADVLVNIDQAPTSQVVYDLYPLGSGAYVRRLTLVARNLHLALFGTSDAAVYSDTGFVTGLWSGAQSPPVRPRRGVRDGQTVKVGVQLPKGLPSLLKAEGLHVIVLECNHKAVAGDARACDTSDVFTTVAKHRDLTMPFRIVTGTVGDGTCNPGQTCYIELTWHLGDPYAESLAEISIAS